MRVVPVPGTQSHPCQQPLVAPGKCGFLQGVFRASVRVFSAVARGVAPSGPPTGPCKPHASRCCMRINRASSPVTRCSIAWKSIDVMLITLGCFGACGGAAWPTVQTARAPASCQDGSAPATPVRPGSCFARSGDRGLQPPRVLVLAERAPGSSPIPAVRRHGRRRGRWTGRPRRRRGRVQPRAPRCRGAACGRSREWNARRPGGGRRSACPGRGSPSRRSCSVS